MARRTVTTFLCDSCGKEKESKELKGFALEAVKRGMWGPRIKFDLCRTCEAEMLQVVRKFFGDELDDLAREAA